MLFHCLMRQLGLGPGGEVQRHNRSCTPVGVLFEDQDTWGGVKEGRANIPIGFFPTAVRYCDKAAVAALLSECQRAVFSLVFLQIGSKRF